MPPAQGGPPVVDAILAHCRTPFAAVQCNIAGLHEPTRWRRKGAQAAALHPQVDWSRHWLDSGRRMITGYL